MSRTAQITINQLLNHLHLCCCVIFVVFAPINAQQYQPDTSRRNYDRRAYISSPTIVTSDISPSTFIRFPNDEQPGSHTVTSATLRAVPPVASHAYYESPKKRADSRTQGCTNCRHSDVDALQHSLMNVSRDALSYDDLYKLLDENTWSQLQIIAPRFSGGEDVERSFSKRAPPAICKPELSIVPLKLADSNEDKDPTLVVVPSCTRVKRCGGCCSTSLVSCQPLESTLLQLEVSKIRYVNGKARTIEREIIPVEEHTKCHCDCTKKEGDCNRLQVYVKQHCSCICKNTEDRYKCLEMDEKVWDPERCQCRCREDCSTGLDQDPVTCKCVPPSEISWPEEE